MLQYPFVYISPSNQPTNQLTKCIWVIQKKLKVSQLVNKFPAFYETRNFITMFTTAHHFSLYWARLFRQLSVLIFLRSILILASHLSVGPPSGLFPSDSPNKILHAFLFYSTPDDSVKWYWSDLWVYVFTCSLCASPQTVVTSLTNINCLALIVTRSLNFVRQQPDFWNVACLFLSARQFVCNPYSSCLSEDRPIYRNALLSPGPLVSEPLTGKATVAVRQAPSVASRSLSHDSVAWRSPVSGLLCTATVWCVCNEPWWWPRLMRSIK